MRRLFRQAVGNRRLRAAAGLVRLATRLSGDRAARLEDLAGALRLVRLHAAHGFDNRRPRVRFAMGVLQADGLAKLRSTELDAVGVQRNRQVGPSAVAASATAAAGVTSTTGLTLRQAGDTVAAGRQRLAAVTPNAQKSAKERSARMAALPIEIAAAIARVGTAGGMVDPFVIVPLATAIAAVTASRRAA